MVLEETHADEIKQIGDFERESIGIPPFLAGYLTGSLDARKELGCASGLGFGEMIAGEMESSSAVGKATPAPAPSAVYGE